MVNIFEGHIAGDIPVVAEFYAPWCGPSALMAPVLHQIREDFGNRVAVLQIDIDRNPVLAQRYQVQTVPTVIVFRKGQVLWRKSGVAARQEIVAHLLAPLV